jgi:dTDP-4-amino-4,6-dideoxygalactose transaminase
MIQILDLREQYAALKPQIDAAIMGVLESGTFIGGPNVAALENEIAAYVGTRYAVGLNSGTDALTLALRALDIGPGDEVITTPFTFAATTEAIVNVGARPTFADIDSVTYNLDPSRIRSAITPRTKAILPVHLYGAPANMDEIVALARRHGLAIVEDCAQAIGADCGGRRVGSIGDVGCFSFFPSKNLGAFGDGGMITTNDERLARRVRRLRAHGASVKYHHEEPGYNSRLDELQAAILRVKLPHLESWIGERRSIAAAYHRGLRSLSALTLPARGGVGRHVFHQYTIGVDSRDDVKAALAAAGVQTMVYYPEPLHLQPIHHGLRYKAGDFPESERAAARVLSLPIYPELGSERLAAVVEAVASAVERPLALAAR